MSKWIYLTDLAPQAQIMNLETGKLRAIMAAAVKDKAPSGLRRGLLEEMPGGTFVETGEFAPITEELLADLEDVYKAPNGWNYDWPHFQVELDGDTLPGFRDKIASRLTTMMEAHPFEFEITGLQRRYLMYYSDGSYNTQKKFASLIPQPDAPPYRRDGTLRRRYDFEWDSIMRDANVPYPKEKEQRYGGLRPCLYYGAAWVVRFRVDGQDVLLDRCRVYVDDEANFICSDWCQRHDFSSYQQGINLQTGIYTFDGWVVNSAISKAMQGGHFKPKGVTIKREAVRDLMKKSHVLEVPKFEDTFTTALSNVKKYAKPVVKAEPKPVVEVGPITADVMAEAQAAFEQALLEAQQRAAEKAAGTLTLEAPAPQRAGLLQANGWTAVILEPGSYGPESYDVYSRRCAFFRVRDDGLVIAREGGALDDGEMPSFPDDDESYGELVRIVDGEDEIAYHGTVYSPQSGDDVESLNACWWLYPAAHHYKATAWTPYAKLMAALTA